MATPATAETARSLALAEANSSAEYAAAMAAACLLMSMHLLGHRLWLEEQARSWGFYTDQGRGMIAPGWGLR
ncbi:MAG: hypothetical protein GYB50_03790 [Rhodobacteraceae bacterium]|nr:hypothetical protein [Paracoccaceae bacterium]